MASIYGRTEGEGLSITPVIRPARKYWFFGGDLVRVLHSNRALGIITLTNLIQDREMMTTTVEFRKKRKKAYTAAETAKLLNCHKKHLPRLVRQGHIPEAIGVLPGGKREFGYRSFYSEDTIMEARKSMSMIHQGQPRKDGRVTNNKTPTEQELRYAMGDGIILYTRDDEGRYIPIFSETI